MIWTARVSAGDTVDFNRDVRPILNQHCVACHGGVKQAADLSFVYAESVLALLEPGDPEASYLMERVRDPSEDRMPPPEHGRPLNAEELATLESWIAQGAEWGAHWAFVPPERQEVPALEDDTWSRQPIDRFVLAELRRAKLEPAAEAEADRWLRRVSLDLIGLPPSPEERAAFLNAVERDGETAYAAAVDRLLRHPGFGERWASMWLDAVRYADSRGLGLDARRTIWKYRDWVIRAFNADMPYDEFTRKQIAGDLFPEPTMDDLVATAVHRLTQTNEEGGTDDEMFRVEAVIDRVNTTWQAWQGLTYGCVQCHSHPYDPIAHEEYYAFMGFFNNTSDVDLGSELPVVDVPLNDAEAGRARELDRKIAALWRDIWRPVGARLQDDADWAAASALEARTSNTTEVEVIDVEGVRGYRTVGNVARGTTVIFQAELPNTMERVTAIRFTGYPEDLQQALLDSEWGYVLSHVQVRVLPAEGEPHEVKIGFVVADEVDPLLDPQLSLNPKTAYGAGPYSRIHYPRVTGFVFDEPVEIQAGDRLEISLAQRITETGAFPLVAKRGKLEFSDAAAWTEWLRGESTQAALAEHRALKSERGKIRSVPIPIMRERVGEFRRPNRVFERGNYLTKTTAVQPSTPAFLPPLPKPKTGGEATRLELAAWMSSTENPLTARVAVNRVWAEIFGLGLVETQEDFGSAGTLPSHPQLLDDLAARFQTDMGWSVKRLLRELVQSATYRQAAKVTEAKLAVDPRNRLLSRGPRGRLSAETIRDQALAVSGLLSEKQFGEPVHPPIPGGVWKPFQGGDRWSTPPTDDGDRYRRSVYTYTKRSIPYPLFASFDAPSREFCSMRRLPSNTPLQALMTLNDQTFVEASYALARRMRGHADDVESQLEHGVLVTTCREATRDEIAHLRALYELRGGDEPLEGLRAVAIVLLNLDEVLTK